MLKVWNYCRFTTWIGLGKRNVLRCVVYYKSLGFAASWTRSLQSSWYCPHLRTTHFIHFQYKPTEVMYLTEHEAYFFIKERALQSLIFTTDYTLQSQQHVFIWTVSIRAFVFIVLFPLPILPSFRKRLRHSNFWVYNTVHHLCPDGGGRHVAGIFATSVRPGLE